ncbi:hypothetical protein [Salinicoccus sp. HZC-1]|uniref:hypothetical protein n=1 Tax=Salinicoccus sp. HZC-1 TaxID=3385497 RepID=UPI00398ADF42
MEIEVQGRKLRIDGKPVEPNLQAFESSLAYRNNNHVFGFINLKDAAGQIVKVAVVSNKKITNGKLAATALSQKIILDEVQKLLKEEFHLKDRYRTDKSVLKLVKVFEKVGTQYSEYIPLKEHVEMISKLEEKLEEALGTLKGMINDISSRKTFDDEAISELLKTYIDTYVFPLEYELQVRGYLLNKNYLDLQHDVHSKRFKLGWFEKHRLKKHVDMMAGLDMKRTPWISILEESLKKPLTVETESDKMKTALESHLRRQANMKAKSILYS